MKKIFGLSLFLSLCGAVIMPVFAQKTETASAATTATGYTKASDVEYVKSGKYVANWGARDEDCVFLSSYATSFYTGSYSFEQMWANAGGSSTSNAPSSALYKSLQGMMKTKHTYETSYGATRDLFCYTDCVSSNYSKISSFYSGKQISGTWDGGKTWNREHTWPNSKGDASGNGENDIIMLRPTSVSENSSRGNKAYGESGGYYDPNSLGQNVRGDCARIVLFVYTRWGNTTNMWSSGGVMENLNVLLKWMEEDPVDTWEMGRNDAVQSITGTRNVFVDYPEYAWKLFGKTAPTDMVTPSGKASNGMAVPDNPTIPDNPNIPETPTIPSNPTTPSQILDAAYALGTGETLDGTYTLTGVITEIGTWNAQYGDVNVTIVVNNDVERPMYCYGLKGATEGEIAVGETITVSGIIKNYKGKVEFDKPQLVSKGTPVIPDNPTDSDSSTDEPNTCNHRYGDWTVTIPATEESQGEKVRMCRYCGYEQKAIIPMIGKECNHRFGDWTVTIPATEEEAGERVRMCRYCGHEEVEVIPALSDSANNSSADSTMSGDALGNMLAGCQAVVGLPMLGVGLLMAGVLLLKRKNDNE